MSMQDAYELMGDRIWKLNDRPNAAHLQATTLAIALAGVYSPPFDGIGVDVPVDGLVQTVDFLLSSGCFPITERSECVDAFRQAVEFYNKKRGVK